jgi:hypothetical protein
MRVDICPGIDGASAVRTTDRRAGRSCLVTPPPFTRLSTIHARRSGATHIIPTSTQQAVRNLGQTVPIDVYTPEETITCPTRARREQHERNYKITLTRVSTV